MAQRLDWTSTLGCQIDEDTRLFGTKDTGRKKQRPRQQKVSNKMKKLLKEQLEW